MGEVNGGTPSLSVWTVAIEGTDVDELVGVRRQLGLENARNRAFNDMAAEVLEVMPHIA